MFLYLFFFIIILLLYCLFNLQKFEQFVDIISNTLHKAIWLTKKEPPEQETISFIIIIFFSPFIFSSS